MRFDGFPKGRRQMKKPEIVRLFDQTSLWGKASGGGGIARLLMMNYKTKMYIAKTRKTQLYSIQYEVLFRGNKILESQSTSSSN